MTARVLVACEYSGTVRRAFAAAGFDAWSCDLLPAEDGERSRHIVGDAVAAAYAQPWDLLIAHPPCTYLSNSSAKHLYAGTRKSNGPDGDRWARMGHGAALFLALWQAPAPFVAVENPIMLGHPRRLFGIPDPTQTIQPWQFGHGETKATCLWLRGLPALVPSNVVEGRAARVHRMSPGANRGQERSRTYQGIADAMAHQWGGYVVAATHGAAPGAGRAVRDARFPPRPRLPHAGGTPMTRMVLTKCANPACWRMFPKPIESRATCCDEACATRRAAILARHLRTTTPKETTPRDHD